MNTNLRSLTTLIASITCGLFSSSCCSVVFGETNLVAIVQSSKSSQPVIDDAESAGLELAKQHLRELVPVLNHLKSNSPPQYEKAIRDLDRAAKKLDTIKRRDAKLFDIALREWKTRGQIDLLKAKFRVNKSDVDKQRMLDRLSSLQRTELERIDRELELLDQREVAAQERIQQSELSLRRGEELRRQLLAQQAVLRSQPIDETSPVYQHAINVNKSDSSSKSKSKKSSE